MKEKVIAVFDVGKTNKKLVLFNYNLRLIAETEEKFSETTDEDGFPCDDIEHIEHWIKDSVRNLAVSDKYDLTAVNFATYGATLAYLDDQGNRLTPVYNYLKPIDERIPERIYKKNGGQDEFCRRTASPALGMLNSGMQALWLKYTRPELFSKVNHILHFPQYLSYLLTGRVYSEHTSIGCHTALWDFDNMRYHHWTAEEDLSLPDPVDVSTLNDVIIEGRNIRVGIGIHDSSSSLAPYFEADRGRFLLVSTGTWCINMNPFNSEILTSEQLDRDCLCYMSIARQPVKSSRLFMGHLHETAITMLSFHFNTPIDHYKKIKPDNRLLEICRKKSGKNRFFFDNKPYSRILKDKLDLFTFKSFAEGYHQLMAELSGLAVEAINLILPADDNIENIYISGGFSGNQLFTKMISEAYPMKRVYTTDISNATALGAALAALHSLEPSAVTIPDLGSKTC